MNLLKQLSDLARERFIQDHPSMPLHAIPRKVFTDKTANGLTKAIIEFLKLKGHQAERINTMGRPVDNRTTITDTLGRVRSIGSVTYIKSTGTIGSADISATIMGRSVKIEVKIRDKQSPEQKQYQEDIERSGGLYYVAKSFSEFYDWYNHAFILEVEK